MAIDIAGVLDGLGTRLATIEDLEVLDYMPDSTPPAPCAVVDWPQTIEYDTTMARGCDRAEIECHVFISMVDSESARDELASYQNGTGSKSVKAAIEGDKTLGGAAQTVRVMNAQSEVWTFNSNSYLAATFTVEVYS